MGKKRHQWSYLAPELNSECCNSNQQDMPTDVIVEECICQLFTELSIPKVQSKFNAENYFVYILILLEQHSTEIQ